MINIKELFKSDLDPNNQDWWSKDKIDKINYNFYQLSNGGMPGPQGTIGPDGDFGPVGIEGDQGPQGYLGDQGPAGATTNGDWIYFPHTPTTPGYLFPTPSDSSAIQYTPVIMKIGVDTNSIGYNTAGFYNDCVILSNLSNTTTPIPTDSIKINLRLQHETKVSDFQLKENLDFNIGKFVTGDPGFTIIHVAENDVINISDSTNPIDAHDGNSSEYQINVPAITTASTKSNDSFSYNVNPTVGYILTAMDNSGKVQWRKKSEVLASFPVGSIISIRPSDFNINNFYLTETVADPGASPLSIRYGRGKTGTDYDGWYLCNGKEWGDGSTIYKTPNLNSFDYDIQSNGNGQVAVVGRGDNTPIMIGGYDIEMESINVNGVYTNQFTNTWEDNDDSSIPFEFKNELGTAPIVDVSRMIHIIYLEDPNYTWSDNGLQTVESIALVGPNTSLYNACTLMAPQITYDWVSNGQTWSTFDAQSAVNFLFNQGTTTYAPSGYYKYAGDVRYWNSTNGTFGDIEPCNFSAGNEVELSYSINVSGVNNGQVYTSNLYYIDSTTFLTATTLNTLSSQPAPAGWYRDYATSTFGSLKYRRYWDGTQFLGETTNFRYIVPYVSLYGTPVMLASSNTNACLINQTESNQLYFATNDQLAATLIYSDLGDLAYSGNLTIFGHLDWTEGVTTEQYPLVKLKSQPAPNALGTQTATHILEIRTGYTVSTFTPYDYTYQVVSIDSNSVINTPYICGNQYTDLGDPWDQLSGLI